MLCSRLTDFFRYLARRQGYVTFAYVDDVIGCERKDVATAGYKFLIDILQDLNFPVSHKKLVAPTTRASCLGIIIDTQDQTVSIPEDKANEIIKKCDRIFSKKKVTKRDFQSLLGSLMFVHKCVKSSRIFTNRLFDALRNAQTDWIYINKDIKRDLTWFKKFIPVFYGTASYVHPSPRLAHTLAIDASLHRVGGVWGSRVYSAVIPNCMKTESYNICHFEMINIMIALKLWYKDWAKHHIQFFVDNEAVVQIMNSGKTKDKLLAMFARNIWFITSTFDITISVRHIPGRKNNIADLLSRWSNQKSDFEKLNTLIGNPYWEEIPAQWFEVDNEI